MEQTEMEFPHQGGKLAARHPFFGPSNSKTLLESIRHENYSEPAFPELTSFIHRYYGEKGHRAREIREIMTTKYFVGFTAVLYLPGKKEVFFIDRPVFHRDAVVDTDNLLSRLKLGKARASVPFDKVETGSVPFDKISKNPFFRAVSGGEEGAEKLAEIASMHTDKKGHIFVPDISYFTSPQARIALLYSYDKGRSLTVSLNGSGYSTNSYAPGLIGGRN